MQLQPLDIVVVDGQWFNPAHWMIQWRSLDRGVHCFTIISSNGDGYNPKFKGVQVENISQYKGRNITIVRYKHEFDSTKLLTWLSTQMTKSTRYDFFRQWLLGFVLGITSKFISNDPTAWTCSELSYWAFQDNDLRLTTIDEVLPLPRLFKYHNDFEVIFTGKY